MEERVNEDALPLQFIVVMHLLGIAATVMVLVWCIHFRWGLAFEAIHPVMMTIGFIILGGEAILCHRALPSSKDEKKLIHLTLHGFALILGIVGTYAAFKFHKETSTPNLWHPWMGIGVICLYGIQWIFGFVKFFYPGESAGVRAESLPWHVPLLYMLILLTAHQAFRETIILLEYGPEAYLVYYTDIVTFLFGGFISLVAIPPARVEDGLSYGGSSL